MSEALDPWSSVEVLYQSPCLDDPKNARFVLISELHNREDIRRVHAAFIDAVLEPNTLLLLECHKAGKLLEGEKKNRVVREYLIPEALQEKLTVMGWDYYGEDLDATSASVIEKKAHIKLLTDLSVSPELESDPERKRELQDRIREKTDELEKDEAFLLEGHLSRAIKDPTYLHQFSIERQLCIAQAISEVVKIKGMPPDPLYVKNIKKILSSRSELVCVDFPIRTKLMTETLKALKETDLCDRIFLIAGKNHLIEHPRAEFDPRVKLTTLFSFLDTVPAIVVTMKESG
jgi:hypothetical protein